MNSPCKREGDERPVTEPHLVEGQRDRETVSSFQDGGAARVCLPPFFFLIVKKDPVSSFNGGLDRYLVTFAGGKSGEVELSGLPRCSLFPILALTVFVPPPLSLLLLARVTPSPG